MKTTHTPGPWDMMTAGGKQYVVGNKGNHGVAQIHGVDETKIQANARLIAAAPELLAALEDLLAWANLSYSQNQQTIQVRDQARAAITKATNAEM